MDVMNTKKLAASAEPCAKCETMLESLTNDEAQALCEMLAGNRPYRTVEDAYNNLSLSEKRVMIEVLSGRGITSQM